jgi:hypothetical protein
MQTSSTRRRSAFDRYVTVAEPIDYVALAAAYRAADWKIARTPEGIGAMHFPEPATLEHIVESCRNLLSPDSRPGACSGTAGIMFHRPAGVRGPIVVSIDCKLGAFYAPAAAPQPEPATAT